METILTSIAVVAIAEIGDKTQLLAMLLAAKFRKPVPIILGILVATLANHAMAGAVGDWVAGALGPDLLRWVHVAFTDSFLATHRVWGGPIPGGEDAYVREWAKAGELVGVSDPPRCVPEDLPPHQRAKAISETPSNCAGDNQRSYTRASHSSVTAG